MLRISVVVGVVRYIVQKIESGYMKNKKQYKINILYNKKIKGGIKDER